MSLQKVTYVNEQTVITAENLNDIQDEIIRLAKLIDTNIRIAEIELLAENWVGTANPYYQTVMIDGVTPNSQVDLTPSVEQLVVFYEKDLTFVTENEDGVVTVYAIGQKPEHDYIVQVTITEVNS
jgi:hypothetical protein